MLGDQIPAFTGRRDFEAMILGLLAIGDRFAALLSVPRSDDLTNDESAFTDFALGIISLRRTLHAVLTTRRERAAVTPPSPIKSTDGEARWMR